MEKTLIYCDRCGKPDARRLEFEVDKEIDGAGDTDYINARVDLCAECEHQQLMLFVQELPWSSRERFAERILKDKKFYLSDSMRRAA